MKKSKVSIHDIARELKINSSTVSRALSDSPRVSRKTKEKIIAKANELGYQRNLLASSLRNSKSNTIGLIVPRISRHFFASAIAGIEEVAYKEGYNLIICQSLEQLEREQKIIQTLSQNRVDGILISVSMETKNNINSATYIKNNIPVVFFDRHLGIPESSSVIIDDFQGGFDATEHLILQGCKRIAHFAGPQELEIYKNRYKGYKAALEKHHIEVEENLVMSSKLMESDGVECAKKLLSQSKPVDGIFSANDVMAISAMQYIKEQGLRIPEDIAMVGFSNEPISSVMVPSLTTVDQPGFEMGKIAANLLISQINDKEEDFAQTIVLKPALIVRNSSKRLPD